MQRWNFHNFPAERKITLVIVILQCIIDFMDWMPLCTNRSIGVVLDSYIPAIHVRTSAIQQINADCKMKHEFQMKFNWRKKIRKSNLKKKKRRSLNALISESIRQFHWWDQLFHAHKWYDSRLLLWCLRVMCTQCCHRKITTARTKSHANQEKLNLHNRWMRGNWLLQPNNDFGPFFLL